MNKKIRNILKDPIRISKKYAFSIDHFKRIIDPYIKKLLNEKNKKSVREKAAKDLLEYFRGMLSVLAENGESFRWLDDLFKLYFPTFKEELDLDISRTDLIYVSTADCIGIKNIIPKITIPLENVRRDVSRHFSRDEFTRFGSLELDGIRDNSI